jgi:hypothetical protein
MIQPRPASAVERMFAGAGAALMPAAAGFLWYFEPTKAGFFPVCPLYAFAGLACPGCGLTRGFHALLHGDIAAALGFNALIPLYFSGSSLRHLFPLQYVGRGLLT